MTTDTPISVGLFDGFSWIQCEGKGSFLNSPLVKAFGDARIAAGDLRLIVDLGKCTGMDSTFMGTLAGIATRLAVVEGGVLQIADAGERNRRSLEDLGLDFLMEIDPPSATWRDQLESIRRELKPQSQAATLDQIQRTRHVLQAHEVLSGMSGQNALKFDGVLTLLQKELSEKEKLADSDKAK